MNDSRKYLEAAVRKVSGGLTEEESEIVTAIVADLPFDSFTFENGVLRCYIQEDLFDRAALEDALSSLPGQEFSIEISKIEPRNWNSAWEDSFESVRVDDDVIVHSPSIQADPSVRYEIAISPDMAFGTGSHATTRMMLRWMVRYEEEIRGADVFDIGCGSGVLAILAAKIGAASVTAADIDAPAAESAVNNAKRNGAGEITVLHSDASILDGKSAGCILANIHKNVIISELPRFARSLRKGGLAFFSGFYIEDAPSVAEAARKAGLRIEDTMEEERWCSLCASKL